MEQRPEGRKKQIPGYGSCRGMLQRCRDPRHNSFRYYGARGISVCARWPRPSKAHSLERPNGGDYEPSRVIWGAEQAASRAAPDRVALSVAGKKGASAKKALFRKSLEMQGQLFLMI